MIGKYDGRLSFLAGISTGWRPSGEAVGEDARSVHASVEQVEIVLGRKKEHRASGGSKWLISYIFIRVGSIGLKLQGAAFLNSLFFLDSCHDFIK